MEIIRCPTFRLLKEINKKIEIDFGDLTFRVPSRQYSHEQLDNICLKTEYLLENLDTDIEVLDAAFLLRG